MPDACEIQLSIKNSGKTEAKDILVELRVFKPQGVHPGKGLFFNTDIGDLGSFDVPGIRDMSQNLSPRSYRYR
jgi:hypothetical protein